LKAKFLSPRKNPLAFLEFFDYMPQYITRKFDLLSQVSYAKKKIPAYVLEAVLLLLSFGCLGLVGIDPSVRPMFLLLTKDVVLAYIERKDDNTIDRTD
jgi:hypothetical protein